MAWEGERTLTFTMEDALISPAGFMILSGAGLIEASEEETIKVHTTEQTDKIVVGNDGKVTVYVSSKPYTNGKENFVYVMLLDNGEVVTEPFIPEKVVEGSGDYEGMFGLELYTDDDLSIATNGWTVKFEEGAVALVDYYVEQTSGVSQIEITPDKFGGNYYVEASTLFRGTN